MVKSSLTLAAILLTLIALSAWRLRGTPIGRCFLAFVGLAGVAAIVALESLHAWLAPDEASAVAMLCVLAAGASICRLSIFADSDGAGAAAPRDTTRLSILSELAVWLPPLAVFVAGEWKIAALWLALVFATASIRLSRVPRQGWRGFRRALWLSSASLFVVGLVPLGFLAGMSSQGVMSIAAVTVTACAGTLFFTLPRLGLLRTDRVQHGDVIQAMSDGVLVVDRSGRLTDFNQAARDILDLDEAARDLRPVAEALEHHPELVRFVSGAIDGRSVYSPESQRDPGADATFDLQSSALFDASGAVQSRVVVLRDITDRIEIERENRRQARHVRLVHEVSAAVHEAETIDSGIEAALELIANTLELPLGQFLRSTNDPEGGTRLEASGIVYCAVEIAGLEIGVEEQIAAPVPSNDRRGAFMADDVRSFDPRGLRWWKELGFETALSIPVLIGPRLYGMIEFFSRDRIEVENTTNEMLEHVGDLVGRAVERKLAEEKIRRMAFRDDLTGLPNRQRFQHLLRGAVSLASRSGRRMALLFMDLDGFKKVNDTLGHEAGDHLLAEVAARFSQVVRVSDHIGMSTQETAESAVSRLGGDEFTVLLSEIHEPADAALVANRILATLEAPIVVGGKELFMSTSIGIAVFPDDGQDTESLLRNADAAMYFAKGRGRNGYQFYSEEMNRTRAAQMEIEARLRGALDRDDFQLYYQPILDAETGEVVAAEALLRWIDEEHGFIPPDEFVPVAEETGLIVSIGQWVFRTACIQAERWRREFGRAIRIGVNVSGHQIREPGMLDMVREAIADSGVAPEQVELELTESTIMQDDTLTVRTLRELRAMGIGLALDDFGTGYSSLSYLRRFTIDRVKIDRSFVNEVTENADDAALTAAIIAMAHGLRLRVVAEGVETTRQALYLKQRGCDELQGYLFGRPCPADEFVDRLRAEPFRLGTIGKDEEPADDGQVLREG